MKKITIILSIVLVLIPSFVKAEALVTPNAKEAVLIDQNTKEILYGKEENKRVSVASLTKMMGLILKNEKIDNGALKTNEILTVSKNAKEMGGTQIWLEEGEKISVDDLIKGITMASANDAMVQMAERISGTEEAFVEEMNKKVKELGLKNTNFVNSTGLDEEGNYSSAYDMAVIASELIKHPKVLQYTSKYEDYIRENTDNKTWIVNTNKLVKFYEGVDGLKTGYTDSAGSTIAATVEKDGLRLIAVTLGYANTKTRNSETIALLDYGFNKYISKVIFKKGTIIKKIKINKSNNEEVNLILKNDLKATTKKEEQNKKYTYDVLLKDISVPVKKGEKLGTIYLKYNNKIIKEEDLISDKEITKASLLKQYIRVIKDMISGNIN